MTIFTRRLVSFRMVISSTVPTSMPRELHVVALLQAADIIESRAYSSNRSPKRFPEFLMK